MALEVSRSPLAKLNDRSVFVKLGVSLVIVAAVVMVLTASLYIYYQQALQPRKTGTAAKVHLTILEGESTAEVAQKLEDKKLISDATVLRWYIRLQQPSTHLKAGRYAFRPSMSVPQIVDKLVKGETDLFLVTILPGKTLIELKRDFLSYGYTLAEINAAYQHRYSHPLLASLPKGQSIEGYIFPETYEVQSDTTLETLFIRDFSTLYQRLNDDNLIQLFKQRGLTLHQALTMASIIEKETSKPTDQKKVAQVLYKRLKLKMKLEVDPTFVYAAMQRGVEPSVSIDSPYNTRLHKGLPPGPIANPDYSALQAVAYPAKTNFLYFVAGDDGTNYFSKTKKQHDENVARYCTKLCE